MGTRINKNAHFFMVTFQLMQSHNELWASSSLEMLMTETTQLGKMDSMTE